MKIEFVPKVKVTSEEKHITSCFCKMCYNFDEMLNDCDNDVDEVRTMIEKNILLDWDDFMTAVKCFTLFIRNCEDD